MRSSLTVYGSDDCRNCNTLERVLNKKRIDYIFSDDKDEILKISNDTGIMNLPIIQDEPGHYMAFEEFITKI